MHSSAAARPTSGCEPAPSPSVTAAPSWIRRSDFDCDRACASVLATTNSTPRKPALIMLLTALPPPPPTPKTVIRGLSSVMSGFCRLMLMSLVPFRPNRLAAAVFLCGFPRLIKNSLSATGRFAENAHLYLSSAMMNRPLQNAPQFLPPADRSEARRPRKKPDPWQLREVP